MKSRVFLAICAGLLLFQITGSALAQSGGPTTGLGPTSTPRDPATEQAITIRLAAINPAAVPIFTQATVDMDAGHYTEARAGYQQVLALAPAFPDALRRLSYVLLELNDPDGAVAAARQAVAADPGGYNLEALASALLTRNTPADQVEALRQARAAVVKLPNDPPTLVLLGFAGVENNASDAVHQASSQLLIVAPNLPTTHFLNGAALAEDGRWEASEQEMLFSQKLGMPADMVNGALASGISGQASIHRWLRRGAYAIGFWLLGLLLLLAGGSALSQVTLAAVNRPARTGSYQLSATERGLRTVYRAVVVLTAAYYYLSIPLLIVVVLALAAGLAYVFLAIGQIPISLAVILGLGLLYTLVAIVRSLFLRAREVAPGRPLLRSEAPDLWALAEAIARKLNTRPIDAIYVTPGVEIAVTERGSLLAKQRGQAERALILGLGTLPGMTGGQLRAILAHEYGHFSNRDTAGGSLDRRVQISIHSLAYRLARSGQATWLNPAWLFVNAFNRIFLRVALGASRLQEILADRYAVLAYGVQDFSEGLSHVSRQTLVFNESVNQEVHAAHDQQRQLQNLYALTPVFEPGHDDMIEKKFSEAMTRPTSAYDSHPALKDRLRLVSQLGAPMQVDEDPRPAWDLLNNAADLQSEMTTVVQKRLRK